MKTHQIRALAGLSFAFAAALTPASAITYYNWISPTGGSWDDASNWDPSVIPSTVWKQGATLGNVTSGTREITIGSVGSGDTLGELVFNQETAGAVNLLRVERKFTVYGGFALEASAGTVQITVGTATNGVAFYAPADSTIGTNGVLRLENTSDINGAGTLTVSGGTLTLGAVTGSSAIRSGIANVFNMSSGSIIIDNAGEGIVRDRRLVLYNNVNITGGFINSTHSGSGGAIQFSGATITFNPDSYDTNLLAYFDREGDQSITTNQSFTGTGLILRGYGVKTINSSVGTIGKIELMDGASDTKGTTLKLDSDLALASGAAQPAAAGWGHSSDTTTLQLGIDTNGHTLDLSTGGSSGVWTPNRGTGSTSATWTLSNSGTAGTGGIKATGFYFASNAVTVDVGFGLVLTAAGGGGTSNNLGSAGTFDSTAKFVYAGNATSANAATLSSGRAIGALQVDSGYLRTTGATFNAAGGIAVDAGATLDLATTVVTAPSITLGIDGANAAQIIAASYTYAGDLSLDFASAAVAGTYDLFSFSGTVTAGLSSVSLSGLHNLSLSGSSGVWTGTIDGYTFTFTESTGGLLVSAIPEPSTFALLAGAATLGACALRRRRRV